MAIVEVRPGEGGDDAALFAAELTGMIGRWLGHGSSRDSSNPRLHLIATKSAPD